MIPLFGVILTAEYFLWYSFDDSRSFAGSEDQSEALMCDKYK